MSQILTTNCSWAGGFVCVWFCLWRLFGFCFVCFCLVLVVGFCCCCLFLLFPQGQYPPPLTGSALANNGPISEQAGIDCWSKGNLSVASHKTHPHSHPVTKTLSCKPNTHSCFQNRGKEQVRWQPAPLYRVHKVLHLF